MAQANDENAILLENLRDAGCGENLTGYCMGLAEKEKYAVLFRVLAEHRKELLEIVHQNQKQIDCLDFLLYKIRKDGTES